MGFESNRRMVLQNRKCARCDNLFVPRQPAHSFCSTKCVRLWELRKRRVCSPKNRPKWSKSFTCFCSVCNSAFSAKSATAKYCSPVCRATRAAEVIPASRWIILQRDKFRCVYCGASPGLSDTELHVDHIVPQAKGGLSQASNLISACAKCNLGKHDTPLPPETEQELLQIADMRNRQSGIHPKQQIKGVD